jgi:hypothetical protein
MVRVRGQGGGLGRSADLVFQSQPKFFKIQPIQPRIQPNFSKKKAWISLDFWWKRRENYSWLRGRALRHRAQ